MRNYFPQDPTPEEVQRRNARIVHAKATYLKPVQAPALRKQMCGVAPADPWPGEQPAFQLDGQMAPYLVCISCPTNGQERPID
jgi:hypothetical protein